MLSPPKKGWNRFASKVISKLGRFSRPGEAITRTTRRFLGRLGTTDVPGRRRCCHCRCHYVRGAHNVPEYWVQVHRSYWSNNNNNVHELEDEGLEFVEDLGDAMEDQAVDEKAEEFIAKFHRSLKLDRLQHFLTHFCCFNLKG